MWTCFNKRLADGFPIFEGQVPQVSAVAGAPQTSPSGAMFAESYSGHEMMALKSWGLNMK